MKDFVVQCVRTEAPITQSTIDMLISRARMIHASMGIQTEGGELTDALKKHIFYGKPLDLTNVKEEAADLLWYIGELCDVIGCTVEELQQLVIAKLRTRYPDKFTEYDALNRKLDAERDVMEGNFETVVDETLKLLHEQIPGVKDLSNVYNISGGDIPIPVDGKYVVMNLSDPNEKRQYAARMAGRIYRKLIKDIDPKLAGKIDNTIRAIEETLPPLRRTKE